MAYVRILVDGYSLLHRWPELAPSSARHSEAARSELVHVLTGYQDSISTPITVVFDGAGAPKDVPKPHSTRELEVIFSGKGKTADDVIERVACRLKAYGTPLVITDDRAERDTVTGFGGVATGCEGFIREIEERLEDQGKAMERHNRWEKERFNRAS
jgi:predicted RNA-binding protein with PIN domain